MTSAIEIWQPVTSKRDAIGPEIRLDVPAENRCEIDPHESIGRCPLPGVGMVFWMSPGWTSLENGIVCAKHVLHCRELGGCLIFPLNRLPNVDHLLAAVNAEIARRRPPQPQQYVYQFATGSMYNNSTGTTTWTFHWQ